MKMCKEREGRKRRDTVFPRIVRARSINVTVCVMRGQFEGALYLRVGLIQLIMQQSHVIFLNWIEKF